MMKVVLLVCCLSIATDSFPQNSKNARINKYSFDPFDLASRAYRFLFDTSDGTRREEIGGIVDGKEDEGLVVEGIYSYIGPEGRNYTVQYKADKDGFHPQGEHLPPSAGVNRTKPLGISSCLLASCTG